MRRQSLGPGSCRTCSARTFACRGRERIAPRACRIFTRRNLGALDGGPSANVVLTLADPVATDLLLELAILPLLFGEVHPVCAFSVTLNGSVVLRVDETRGGINRYEVHIPRALCADTSCPAVVLGHPRCVPGTPGRSSHEHGRSHARVGNGDA